MTRIIISGANGKMGKVIQSVVSTRDDCEIVAGIDLNTEENGSFPIYSTIFQVNEDADVIIDFTNPVLLDDLLSYSKKTGIALVLATTGYDDDQKKKIEEASKTSPIFFTYNMSMGINLLSSLAKKAVEILGKTLILKLLKSITTKKLTLPAARH